MDSRRRIVRRALAEYTVIAKRIQRDPSEALGYARGNVARMAECFDGNELPDWLVEWQRLLAGPLDALLVVLTADTDAAARLRTTSPFLGLLTFPERIRILRGTDPDLVRALKVFESGRNRHVYP